MEVMVMLVLMVIVMVVDVQVGPSYVRNDLYLHSNNEVPSLDSRNNRVFAINVVTQD